MHEWLRGQGLGMIVKYKKASLDPTPERSHVISSTRYRRDLHQGSDLQTVSLADEIGDPADLVY